ncbi:uncharacterized protein STEHIDRAFT_151696 [Stereum hirsutum FP-91666 SS1]|uniref:uncharacterized protein n=1 Tax=Stereum hirsutum (strain FP-91666) TaxID=721885 RepID=UPI000440CF79|nr:uncharacterized protein STEHIDRAFT_151696 [Stereum hirsutum FP-91666 SS1]EIM92366.1 hypothetical protein STEHIDRAFT_151696 [Stereum hirsutum FP-91666 SS1]
MASDTSRRAFWAQLKKTRIPETLNCVADDVQLRVKACDDEIAFARAYVQELSAARNALVSTTQFPSEIFTSIFHFLVPVLSETRSLGKWNPLDTDSEIAAGTRSLIAASHVCRRWREVALECSALWTVLWTENIFWLPEMLNRAKNMPLAIVQPQSHGFQPWSQPQQASPRNPSENIDFLIPLLFDTKQPRYLCLYLNMQSQVSTDSWADVLLRPAPYLEVLEVVVTVLPPDFLPFSIPATLLGRNAPALRSLILQGPISHEALWPSPVLRGLVSLQLGSAPMAFMGNVSLRDVLKALRHMRQLETLTIEFPSIYLQSSPQASYFLSNSTQEDGAIHLPRLAHLCMKGSVMDMTALSKCIVIAPNAEMQYDITLSITDVCSQLADDISALLHPAPMTHSTVETYEITFSAQTDPMIGIRCWDQVLALDHSSLRHPRCPRLALTFFVYTNHVVGQFPLSVSDFLVRNTRALIDIMDMLSPFLPFDRSRDLRLLLEGWGSDPDILATRNDSTRDRLLQHFYTTRRLVFENFHVCRDILSGIASNTTLLRHLNSIHYYGRRSPDPLNLWAPPIIEPSEQELRDLAADLRRVAETRQIQTFEWRGGPLTEEYAHLFEGIAQELIWS